MNFIDIIVVVIIALYALIGFWKGFVSQLFQFIGIFCAFYFNTPVSNFISGLIYEEPQGVILMMVQIAAFMLIFAVFYITGIIISKTFEFVLTSIPNRIAGVIFGVLNGFMVVSVLFLLIRSIGNGDEFLKKYVTPDNFTDEMINKGLDLASEAAQEDKSEDIEALKKDVPDINSGSVGKEPKVYSRLGYAAYRISTMMDPFVLNIKTVFKKKFDDIIEDKVKDKISDLKDSLKQDR